MNKSMQVQELSLNELRKNKVQVSIFLVSGVKLQGVIESFDSFIILLQGPNKITQLVYKHGISTIVPDKGFKFNIKDLLFPADDNKD